MNRRRPVPPVRPAGRSRVAPPTGDLEATRIARVDPRTGSEIRLPATAAGLEADLEAADPDATVIGAVPTSLASGRPTTAEIVPPRDARLSSEVTAAWAQDSSRGAGRLVRRVLSRHRRIAVVASGTVTIVAFAASVLATGRDAAPLPEPPSLLSAEAPPPPAPGPTTAVAPGTATPVDEIPAAPAEDTEALASRAAGALADGRLDEARALYSSLVASDPARREWSLAVEILGGPEGAR